MDELKTFTQKIYDGTIDGYNTLVMDLYMDSDKFRVEFSDDSFNRCNLFTGYLRITNYITYEGKFLKPGDCYIVESENKK